MVWCGEGERGETGGDLLHTPPLFAAQRDRTYTDRDYGNRPLCIGLPNWYAARLRVCMVVEHPFRGGALIVVAHHALVCLLAWIRWRDRVQDSGTW